MRNLSTLIIGFLLTATTLFAYSDSTFNKILGYPEFIEQVKNHHPIALQAQLITKKGDALVQSARGNFDPKLQYAYSDKEFNQTDYYELNQIGLKIPTWYGLEFNGGYQENNGNYLNPENNTPSSGLWQLGASLNLGQGLFIDKRRAALKKAKLLRKSSMEEQKILLNELIMNAGESYWDWFEAHNNLQVYQQAHQLAEQRFKAVKLAVAQGDKPGIDTIEAKIQVQNRLLNLQQAELNFQNTSLLLATYLWLDGSIPLELQSGTIPHPWSSITLETNHPELIQRLDDMTQQHPYLKMIDLKIEQLEVTRKLQREMLKPQFSIKYNAINQPVGNDPLANYNSNNYTFGVALSMPLFLRKERGDLNWTYQELNTMKLELDNQKANLIYKARSAINKLSTSLEQALLYEETVLNYQQLLSGEKKKFDAGESSLFMVNSRELGFINAQLKYNELLSKNKKNRLLAEYNLMLLAE